MSGFLLDPGSRVVLEHRGAVDAAMIPAMVERVEEQSRLNGDRVPMRKKLIYVMVEAVDNLSRHATGPHADSNFVALVRDGEGYRLATGNAVPVATAALLGHRVGILNQMDPEDLREHYLKLLSNDNRSANGGAGLGLLTMARKTVRPIRMEAAPLGPFMAYLTFELRVGNSVDHTDPAAA